MSEQGLSGVFAALLTPYDQEGRVDAGVVRTLTRYLLNEGMTGTCPAGSTGEFPFLTRDEKALVNRSACEAAGEDGAIIAGVWGATQGERAWLAQQVEESGAAAVFLTTPYYYPATPESLLNWYRSVHRSTRLPVFAYNIPQCTGNEIPLSVLDALTNEGTIQGYKDSSPDRHRIQQVVKLLKGRIPVFAGSESLFGEARELGVDGFISGMANVFPRTVSAVWRGDRGAAQRIATLKDAIRKAGGVPAMKYLMKRRGFAVGDPREPLAPPTEAVRKELEQLEQEYGKEL